jgi:hypothetical protein
MKEKPHAVFLIRDDDRKPDRRKGLGQARAETTLACPIVVGLAHRNRECWVLAGFEPVTPDETARLSAIRNELSFDPRTEAHRLNGKKGEPRCPKRVLRELTRDDPVREARCWREPPLEVLRNRGQTTGLADYLEEVRDRIVPLF